MNGFAVAFGFALARLWPHRETGRVKVRRRMRWQYSREERNAGDLHEAFTELIKAARQPGGLLSRENSSNGSSIQPSELSEKILWFSERECQDFFPE